MKIVIDIPDGMYGELLTWKFSTEVAHRAISAITRGRILPKGAEILTAEAYSDLCLRASKERKTGRWISHIERGIQGSIQCWVCSECRELFSHDAETGIEITDYRLCPNCGAKMEGAEE